jgi:hypothetical protein
VTRCADVTRLPSTCTAFCTMTVSPGPSLAPAPSGQPTDPDAGRAARAPSPCRLASPCARSQSKRGPCPLPSKISSVSIPAIEAAVASSSSWIGTQVPLLVVQLADVRHTPTASELAQHAHPSLTSVRWFSAVSRALRTASAIAGFRSMSHAVTLADRGEYPARMAACVALRSTRYSTMNRSCFGVINSTLCALAIHSSSNFVDAALVRIGLAERRRSAHERKNPAWCPSFSPAG